MFLEMCSVVVLLQVEECRCNCRCGLWCRMWGKWYMHVCSLECVLLHVEDKL